jgi:hypothetical protein
MRYTYSIEVGDCMADEEGATEKRPVPYVLALIICDAIWRDPATGKRTILGCFSAIHAKTFPTMYPMLCVHAAITDGRGVTPIVLRLVDVDENNPPVFEQKAEVKFDDPRIMIEVDFIIPNVLFPAAGEYRLQLLSSGESLMERRILLLQVGEPT